MPHHPELERWLNNATRDLPAETATQVRQELLAHYEDAFDDYHENGLSEEAAHQHAMHDLGAADIVANGLNGVHRGRKTYGYALAACFLTFATLMIFPMMHKTIGLDDLETTSLILVTIYDILLTLFVGYILTSFGKLLAWRVNMPSAPQLTTLVMGGLVVGLTAEILNRWLYQNALYPAESIAIRDASATLEGILLFVAMVGRLVLGISLFPLGRLTYQASSDLYGLGKPLAILMILFGIGAGTTSIWTQLNLTTLNHLSIFIIMMAHLFIWTLMILLYFRLIYRNPVHPTRFA